MTADHSFTQLIHAYKTMDEAWDRAAGRYDFKCSGCTDNCCQSLFFHHTFIETHYLIAGFEQLDPHIQKDVKEKAAAYIEQTFTADEPVTSRKIMCPLNREGLCILYRHRPMICRLHGLPHELCRPGRAPVKGPGCDAGQFDSKSYIPFDRTPFYQMMAKAEMQFRTRHSLTGKIKQTVSHMLLD